jgi:indole-3-glycerol phosphate synthase
MAAGLLERILQAKQAELAALRRRRLPAPPPLRPVELARPSGQPLRLIAEIKRRSPSAGALSTLLTPAARAAAYERAGARMLSVLCDREFFDGGYEDLAAARRATRLPLLCKEFVLDECQLDAARAYGASAVLLIVRCLAPARLRVLVREAERRDLVPFVEVVTDEEARLALDAGSRCIGVNARDLDTLVMDAQRARRVLEALPPPITRVHLSGIASPERVSEVARSGVDAALVGEVLMRQDDPEPLLRSLVDAAR